MSTLEQRVSRLEGGFGHLATKADLAELRSELLGELLGLKAELRGDLLKVVIGLASLQLLGLAAVAAIMRFLG